MLSSASRLVPHTGLVSAQVASLRLTLLRWVVKRSVVRVAPQRSLSVAAPFSRRSSVRRVVTVAMEADITAPRVQVMQSRALSRLRVRVMVVSVRDRSTRLRPAARTFTTSSRAAPQASFNRAKTQVVAVAPAPTATAAMVAPERALAALDSLQQRTRVQEAVVPRGQERTRVATVGLGN